MSSLDDFDDFYLASRDRLVACVAALTGDLAEAQDHVQEGFVRAWAHWDRISAYDNPEAWVLRCSYNLAVSRWRRARKVILRSDIGVARPLADPADVSLVEALGRLPERQRRALVLQALVGLSVVDIAREMDAPEGTVKSWLSRGRTRLGHELYDTNEKEAERDAG
jgi:RNA polymerase sigma-70 factor, ECF subfamily